MISRCVAVALLSSAIAACTTPAGQHTSLANTSWRFVTIDGAPPVAADASLEFGERLNANTGCNGMSGPWRVDGRRLIAGPLVATRMFCEGKMEQEAAVSTLLSGSPEVLMDGNRLTLTSSAHSATLTRTGTN